VADGQYAMCLFGDSGSDVGNNNNLFMFIKSNFPPYGRDFTTKQSTGRFYNGGLASDFTGSSFSNYRIQSFIFFQVFGAFP
jgi:hypothetical protein